ncbi:MAG: efflux RND transporter periplasmic adaptor subunit [Candidatus Latescibacteria bacterium]|nr:efflux RND transporter periplasmic adaptor subunit [Candidatus Latescibacterota bacterium]
MLVLLGAALAAFTACGNNASSEEGAHRHEEHGEHADKEKVKGPHGGRLLSEGDFQVEVSIYERGVPPQFRVFAFEQGKPVPPEELTLSIRLRRLGGREELIQFQGEGEYLRGDRVVEEPHSFAVEVMVQRGGQTYQWTYEQVEGQVELPPEALASTGITIEEAGPARLQVVLELPGEIGLNADKVAHVVPRLSGVISEARKGLGEKVRKGEIIAVLESRELADAKSEYLAAVRRVELAQTTFGREERLWQEQISAERDFLEAKTALAEAQIKTQSAEQKLHALGFSDEYLAGLPSHPDMDFTRYEIRAPFDGTLIEKHAAIGEAVKEDADIFVIADLSTVWVEVTVYAQDLDVVRVGQRATVRSRAPHLETEGTLDYLGSLVGEQTRSAKARVVIANPDGQWRPGLFVTVELVQDEVEVPVAVAAEAIQSLRDWSVVFVQYGDLFEARPLELGRSDGQRVEVLSGLAAGERYATRNSFVLKADLGKAGASHDH